MTEICIVDGLVFYVADALENHPVAVFCRYAVAAEFSCRWREQASRPQFRIRARAFRGARFRITPLPWRWRLRSTSDGTDNGIPAKERRVWSCHLPAVAPGPRRQRGPSQSHQSSCWQHTETAAHASRPPYYPTKRLVYMSAKKSHTSPRQPDGGVVPARSHPPLAWRCSDLTLGRQQHHRMEGKALSLGDDVYSAQIGWLHSQTCCHLTTHGNPAAWPRYPYRLSLHQTVQGPPPFQQQPSSISGFKRHGLEATIPRVKRTIIYRNAHRDQPAHTPI